MVDSSVKYQKFALAQEDGGDKKKSAKKTDPGSMWFYLLPNQYCDTTDWVDCFCHCCKEI